MHNIPRRIVFFGDSICVGQGVSPHLNWVNRISPVIADLGAKTGVQPVVANASVNGNTTRMALERMPMDVQQHGVDVLYVQFGLNDCNFWATDRGAPRVSQQAYAANLAEILDRGRIFGARLLFLATNHPTPRTAPAYEGAAFSYDDHRRAYNDIVRTVCAHQHDVVLIDREQMIHRRMDAGDVALEDTLLADGIHLSESGHSLYFDQGLSEVMPAIAQLYGAGAPA